MDDEEKELRAFLAATRYDLNEIQANEWGAYQQKKEMLTARYGKATADTLSQKDREALETKFAKQHSDLDEKQHQQRLNYENGEPYKYLTEQPEIKNTSELNEQKQKDNKTLNDDMTEKANQMIEDRKRRQLEMKARSRDKGRSE